jgi:uncharacterized protein (TIGR00369 family)
MSRIDPSTGMWSNLRLKLVRAEADGTVVEGEVDAAAHGSTGGGAIHRGAVATVADCALACAAASLVEDGRGAATVDLRVEFLRPAQPGPIGATARVTHRLQDLVFCDATVEQGGVAVARASGTIALVVAT